MILSDEVQKSLDILDQVLSEFEDVPSSSESTTAFSSLCDDGSEKGDNRTKKEVYFGVSTVERSMLQGHGKDLKDQSVSNSVSKLEKNLERIRLVQQNSVTNTDFLKVSNDDNIKPTTRCDQSQEILDNNNEAIVPKNLLSFWLDREERTKAECSPTLPKGKEQEQNAKNTPPSKLPKPTNIVKPISKADQFLDSRLPKSKIPVSCDARNTDKLSASKHPSDLQKTKVFKIPAENKVGDRIKFCSNSANEELSNILKPNLREELNDQRFKSLQPKKESMVCDINKTGRSTAIIFQEESKKISEIPVIDSNIEKFDSSPPSKSDICFIQSGSLSEKIRTVEQFSSTSSLNQERGGREKLLSEKKTATLQCNDNYCVSEGDMIEKSSQPYEVCERSVALKPPIENLAEDPCISDKSKEDLVNPQKELKRTTSSDSQTPSQKTTQSTQTTPPCVKQSKWSFSVEPCNSSAIENPQIRHKKRPYSVSPIYSVLDPRSDFEVRYPAQTNMFHSRQHLCPINDGYVATNGFFPQHLHRSLSVSQFMSMEDQIYQQLSIPESPTVLRSAQEKLHMHELQQISRGNNHFLHRMSHAYHKNQRHSINLEHIMSLEQLDVRKAQFQAHARSFNKRSKSFLENKADTRSLENQRKRSHKKPDSSQRNVMKVMAQNKFDEELEYMTSDSQKFAPIIKDKFIKNANIYLPSSPILQLQENCNDESDDKEISDDQNHPFQNSHLSRKMSNDSLCSTKTVEESFRLNRSRSSTSFEYLPENKNGEYLMDSDSPASEKTQKTLVSSSEEITTLRQLISEGIIKLDEVPPGFVPPPPPANIYKHDRDKQRKSHQINVEDNSFVSLSPVAKPSKVLKPIKSLELDNLHRKRLQSNMSKSTENLFRNGFQDKKIPGSGKKEGPLETDDKRQGETKKKNFLFSFWKRKQYTIDPL